MVPRWKVRISVSAPRQRPTLPSLRLRSQTPPATRCCFLQHYSRGRVRRAWNWCSSMRASPTINSSWMILSGTRKPEVSPFEIVTLGSTADGMEQISGVLSRRRDSVAAIHLVSHGTDGTVQLGDSWLDVDNLQGYSAQLAGWANALPARPTYCSTDASWKAVKPVGRLLTLWRPSREPTSQPRGQTGHASLGGDWDLEIKAGVVETGVAFTADAGHGLMGAAGRCQSRPGPRIPTSSSLRREATWRYHGPCD